MNIIKIIKLIFSVLIAGLAMAFSTNYLEGTIVGNALCYIEIPVLCIWGYLGVFIYTRLQRYPDSLQVFTQFSIDYSEDALPVSPSHTALMCALSAIIGAIVYKLPYSAFALAPPVAYPYNFTQFFTYLIVFFVTGLIGSTLGRRYLNPKPPKQRNGA